MSRSFHARCLALGDEILAGLFFSACLSCGRATRVRSLCERCGVFERCSSRECAKLSGARSHWWLGEGALSLLHAIKYEGRYELLFALEEVLVRDFDWNLKEVTVVPVPMHWVRLFHRGFNQSWFLAAWVASRLRANFEGDRLFKSRSTAPQSTLPRERREKNLLGSYVYKGRAPKRVLLVDDVWTTGSTLTACAELLKQHGAEAVYAWTAFRTPAPGLPGLS